jgi:mono/diheme cytochrome c family protein
LNEQILFSPCFRSLIVQSKFTLILGLVCLAGCDAPINEFDSNDVYALTLARSRSTPTESAQDDVSEAISGLFGTPDSPRWPEEFATALPAVDSQRITRAAGPFSSEQDGTHVGLFREHCVICHGLSGSGAGPASQVQNPYPRDFRHGVFKWKSTERADKPTRDDLRQLLMQGIPGTAMPSFSLQEPEDIDALVDYSIYLSARGEVERRLIAAAVDELDYGETAPTDDLRLNKEGEGAEVVDEVVARVAESWRDAKSIEIAPPPPATDDSIENGKAIFHGQIANCVGCHGPNGNGAAVTLDYDDWTKEYSTRIGVTPTDREAIRPFRKAGALRPRFVLPRSLHEGVFRGGGDAETLYRRITQGIAGSPMPAVAVVEEENGTGLTTDQVWDLVRYVQSLSHTAPQ